jgi:hypothetical protein
MVFGSYFGDWDNQNNFLRAPIASKGWGLASVWAGRPYWMMHEAALGAPLYQCVKTSYNCTNIYNVGSNGSGVHVALMGDPTLRVFPVANLQQVTAISNCEGIATLQWQKSLDAADSILLEIWQNNQWNPFGTTTGIDTQFAKVLNSGKHALSIREKKLMQSASGTWWDLGARTLVDLSVNLSDSVNIYSNASKLCAGDTFNIRLHRFGNQQSKIVQWFVNDSVQPYKDSLWRLASQEQGNLQIRVSVVTDSGCTSSDTILVTSIGNDVITWGNRTDTTMQANSLLLLTMRWYRNDTLLAANSAVIKPKLSGVYRVCTIQNDSCLTCSDTLHFVVKRVLNVGYARNLQRLNIYPNPASDAMNLIGGNPSTRLSWQLFNLQGKRMLVGVGDRVDVSGLSGGCYYLTIEGYESLIFWKI